MLCRGAYACVLARVRVFGWGEWGGCHFVCDLGVFGGGAKGSWGGRGGGGWSSTRATSRLSHGSGRMLLPARTRAAVAAGSHRVRRARRCGEPPSTNCPPARGARFPTRAPAASRARATRAPGSALLVGPSGLRGRRGERPAFPSRASGGRGGGREELPLKDLPAHPLPMANIGASP